MEDPTYNTEEIKQNPIWHVAWVLAQIKDDNAPLGWSKWISTAECLLGTFDIIPKKEKKNDNTKRHKKVAGRRS